MCQAYEGEHNYVVAVELREIQAAWENHKSGEKPLNDAELKELYIRKLMLIEAQ